MMTAKSQSLAIYEYNKVDKMKGNQENRHKENSLLRNVCCGLENNERQKNIKKIFVVKVRIAIKQSKFTY